jgi:hypothetical protein
MVQTRSRRAGKSTPLQKRYILYFSLLHKVPFIGIPLTL